MSGFVLNKERKRIIIAGSILLVLGLIYRFAGNFGDMGSTGEDIALKRKKVIKYQQQVQLRNGVEAKRLVLTRVLERFEAGLLNGETPALAAVDIQNILNQLAAGSEVEIRSMQVLKPQTDEKIPYTSIPVRIKFTATIRQLKEMLYRIASSSKTLRVINMNSRLVNQRQPDQIHSTLTIEGFIRNEVQSG